MARHYSEQGFGPPRDDRRERDYGNRESREHFEGRGGRDIRREDESYRDEARGSDRQREDSNIWEPEQDHRYLRSTDRGSNESFDQGRYQTRRQSVGERGSFGPGGRNNFGSSRYGGSDYESNDYGRNESRYGSPYSETGQRQFGGEEWGRDRGARGGVIGDRWTRTAGVGDWVDRSSDTEYDEPYGFLYGDVASYGVDSDRDYGQAQRDTGNSSTPGSRARERDFRGGQDFRSQDFRGRGPRGYQRSDERLREIVCEALTEAPHIDASDIHVEVSERIVKLTGSVPDRRTKYAVEDLVERKSGLADIRNELRVRDQQGQGQAWQGSAGQEQASQSRTQLTGKQDQAANRPEPGKSETRGSDKTKGGT